MFKTFRTKMNAIIVLELLFNLVLYLQFYAASAFALVAYTKNLDSVKSSTNQLSIIFVMTLGFIVCKLAKFIIEPTSENFIEALKTLLFLDILDRVRNMTINTTLSREDTTNIFLYLIVSAFILCIVKVIYNRFDNAMFVSKYFKKCVINENYANRTNEEFIDDLRVDDPDEKIKLVSDKLIDTKYKEYATLTDITMCVSTSTDRKGVSVNSSAVKLRIEFYNLKSFKKLALVSSVVI